MDAKYNKNVEEGGTEATVEASVPPSSSNVNENSEEGAGWKDPNREVLPEEGGTTEALEGSVPPSNSNANDNKIQRRD